MMKKEPPKHKKAFLVSLMAVLLISSLAVGMFTGQAMGQSTVHVGTETELRTAVSNAVNGVHVEITLDREIGLTGNALIIPANKDITLRSNGNAMFELFGATGANVITVENRGILTLAGITVTHASGATGLGVSVSSGGRLTMSGGKISNNTGNGVTNSGNFTMSDGTISNNGGYGVYTSGANTNFIMSGGAISNNGNYGVYNTGANSAFTLNGGEISNNRYGVYLTTATAKFDMTNGRIIGNTGVAVNNAGGTFTMSGGEISSNIGGVSNGGTFTLSNGRITGNTGSGVGNSGNFIMSGGEISGNTISGNGGGVTNSGNFTMSGGEISKNTATNGGGIYVSNGNVDLQGGRISGNTATRNGGGVWVTDTVTNLNRLTIRNGAVFSDNRASASYNRASEHDSTYRAYIEDNVPWTSPFTQGYNNYDISYVIGSSVTKFTVTTDDAHGTPTGAGSYSVGDTVTLNAGTQPGYNFARWAVHEGGVQLANSATVTFTMPASNVNVVAVWTSAQYKITYVLNGGKIGSGFSWDPREHPDTYSWDNLPVDVPDTTKKDGFLIQHSYKFLGWNVTYADGTQTSFQKSYSIPAGTTGDITLEANWASLSLWQNIQSALVIIGIIIVILIILFVVCAACGSSGGSGGGYTHYGNTSSPHKMCESCGQYPAQDGWTLCSNCLKKRHMALSSM